MSVMRARHVAAGYVAVRLQRTGQETHNKRPTINIPVAGSSYRRILNYRDFQIICLPFCTAELIEKMWESNYNQEWALYSECFHKTCRNSTSVDTISMES